MVRAEPKSRGKFYRIFKTCFDLQMNARPYKDEIVNVRTRSQTGGKGCSVTASQPGKRMPPQWMHTTKIVGFYCRLKGFAVERTT